MSADHDPSPPAADVVLETVYRSENTKKTETFWRKIMNWMTVTHEDKGKWLEDMRGILSLVSTMIATMTYQSSINPPGGVLQANDGTTYEALYNCTLDGTRPCPGEAIIASLYPILYDSFQLYNTISFIASLSVTLLLVSGIPLTNRFPMWMLSIGMIVTLTFLALTYHLTLELNNPKTTNNEVFMIVGVSILIWVTLVGIIGLLLTIRFVAWLVNKYRGFKHSKSTNQTN